MDGNVLASCSGLCLKRPSVGQGFSSANQLLPLYIPLCPDSAPRMWDSQLILKGNSLQPYHICLISYHGVSTRAVESEFKSSPIFPILSNFIRFFYHLIQLKATRGKSQVAYAHAADAFPQTLLVVMKPVC